MVSRNIGIDVKAPKSECVDVNCPFHGKVSVRGAIMQGKVVSTKARKTAVIEREHIKYLSKYERYERRHSRIAAHNPECISAKEGDTVTIVECRPLSKTKHFVVVERVGE